MDWTKFESTASLTNNSMIHQYKYKHKQIIIYSYNVVTLKTESKFYAIYKTSYTIF